MKSPTQDRVSKSSLTGTNTANPNMKSRSSVTFRPRRRSKGGRPTREQIAIRHERVLRVASELFVAHGYAAATLESIARRAKVAMRTLYQYGSKEDLFAAVVRLQLSQLELFEAEFDEATSIRTLLNRVARRLVAVCTTSECIALQRFMTAESPRFPDLMLSVSLEGHGRLIAAVSSLLRHATAQGLLKVKHPKATAKMFIELTVGWSLLLCTVGDFRSIPTQKELDERVSVFLNTYGADPGN
jgi:AcrR family transcriptional regulator